MCYGSSGTYGIPKMRRVTDCGVENWIGFNYARSCDKEERHDHGVHFYLDDYQFTRTWSDPERYIKMLADFAAVASPDFSMYTNFPKALQVYNCYRAHWLGRYWQDHGVNVIPNVMWSDCRSFDYCFDGVPTDSVVIVSSVGTQGNETSGRMFMDGYREMMYRLRPVKIFFYGNVPDACWGNIYSIKTFSSQMRGRLESN